MEYLEHLHRNELAREKVHANITLEFTEGILNWLTSYDIPLSILYGGDKRFSGFINDFTSKEIINIYCEFSIKRAQLHGRSIFEVFAILREKIKSTTIYVPVSDGITDTVYYGQGEDVCVDKIGDYRCKSIAEISDKCILYSDREPFIINDIPTQEK